MDFVLDRIVRTNFDVVKYYLITNEHRKIVWIEQVGSVNWFPKDIKLGDVGTGLCLKEYQGKIIPNYRKSILRKKYHQLTL